MTPKQRVCAKHRKAFCENNFFDPTGQIYQVVVSLYGKIYVLGRGRTRRLAWARAAKP